LRIVFDNPDAGAISSENYEKAVSLAASLGWHFTQENAEVSFVAPDYNGSSDIYQFLEYLALVAPRQSPSVIESLPRSEEYNLIVTARPRGSIPTALWGHSYFIFIGEERPETVADQARNPRPERLKNGS